jgi:GNAT superfamily N-acetyltransferase
VTITYQEESFSFPFALEMERLTKAYYEATEAATDMPPLDFDWDTFLALQDRGMLVLVTARDEDILVGFNLYVLHRHLHHAVWVASCDGLSVDHNYRGRGIAKSLMLHAEPILRNYRVNMVTHNFRTCYPEDTSPLFPKLGYKIIQQTYMKEL